LATTDDDIRAFLFSSNVVGDDTLDAALLFALSMVNELASLTSEWEAAVVVLEKKLATRKAERAARRFGLFGSDAIDGPASSAEA
jgi:hypothetical protein